MIVKFLLGKSLTLQENMHLGLMLIIGSIAFFILFCFLDPEFLTDPTGTFDPIGWIKDL